MNTRNPRVGKVGEESPDCVNFLCARARAGLLSREQAFKGKVAASREKKAFLKLEVASFS